MSSVKEMREQGEVKTVAVRTPIALHRALKAAAVMEDRYMEDIVRDLITDYLKARGSLPEEFATQSA